MEFQFHPRFKRESGTQYPCELLKEGFKKRAIVASCDLQRLLLFNKLLPHRGSLLQNASVLSGEIDTCLWLCSSLRQPRRG